MNTTTEVSKQAARAERRRVYREKQQEQDKLFAFDFLAYLQDQSHKLGTSDCVTGCVYVEYLENGWRLIDRADWLSAGPEVELALIGKDTAEEVAVEEIREALSRVRTFQSLGCSEFARIGDRVFYYTRKGDRWSDPKIPYNTTGTVVGREKFFFFVDMLDSKHVYDGNPTGKYESDNGQLIINWDLPEQPKESIGACDLGFVDTSLYADRSSEESRKENQKIREAKRWVCALPDTKARVGDIVISNVFNGYYTQEGRREKLNLARISRTNYYTEDDGAVMVRHELEAIGLRAGSSHCSDEEVNFWESGNYTRWIREQRHLLTFEDLKERCSFYRSLGFIRQQASARSGDYEWTLEEFLQEFAKGNVDALGTSGSFFGSTPFPIAHKVVDPENKTQGLRYLMRQAVIEGFKDKFAEMGLTPSAE